MGSSELSFTELTVRSTVDAIIGQNVNWRVSGYVTSVSGILADRIATNVLPGVTEMLRFLTLAVNLANALVETEIQKRVIVIVQQEIASA